MVFHGVTACATYSSYAANYRIWIVNYRKFQIMFLKKKDLWKICKKLWLTEMWNVYVSKDNINKLIYGVFTIFECSWWCVMWLHDKRRSDHGMIESWLELGLIFLTSWRRRRRRTDWKCMGMRARDPNRRDGSAGDWQSESGALHE